MATPYLPFLWPSSYRTIQAHTLRRCSDIAFHQQATQAARQLLRAPPRAGFHAGRASRQTSDVANQRYGTANEPPPHLSRKTSTPSRTKKNADLSADPDKAKTAKTASRKRDDKQSSKQALSETQQEPHDPEDIDSANTAEHLANLKGEEQGEKEAAGDQPTAAFDLKMVPTGEKSVSATGAEILPPAGSVADDSSTGANEAKVSDTVTPFSEVQANARAELSAPLHDASNALTKILQMPPPMTEEAGTAEDEKPPHLQTPRYMHNFDTYTLVTKLIQDGSFSEQQAIDIMKALRGLLAANMDLARDGLVSKADAEMVSRKPSRDNVVMCTESFRIGIVPFPGGSQRATHGNSTTAVKQCFGNDKLTNVASARSRHFVTTHHSRYTDHERRT